MTKELTSKPRICHLGSLVAFANTDSPHSLCYVRNRTRNKRIAIQSTSLARAANPTPNPGWWMSPCATDPNKQIGDSPRHYHPLYLAAILLTTPVKSTHIDLAQLAGTAVPIVTFETDSEVRRSMTLNAMRMTTEFMTDGSERVMALVDNRLALGQTDVVHDLLVYLMRQYFDIDDAEHEAVTLRADSVAAYLGLELTSVRDLFHAESSATKLSAAITEGGAGMVRRNVDVGTLVQMQLSLLHNDLLPLRTQTATLLDLLDRVADPVKVQAGIA